MANGSNPLAGASTIFKRAFPMIAVGWNCQKRIYDGVWASCAVVYLTLCPADPVSSRTRL